MNLLQDKDKSIHLLVFFYPSPKKRILTLCGPSLFIFIDYVNTCNNKS